MSEPLRIAIAVEGSTDPVVFRAIIDSVLPDAEYELQTLQPEESVAFGRGAGWAGVDRWCRQAANEGGGTITGSSVMSYHDVLLVHVDADVAGKTYAGAHIHGPVFDDLPCELPCPPARDTTDRLRMVVLRWLGETTCPDRVALCTPSKNIEAWVVAAIWPDNPLLRRSDWECRSDPGAQLSRLPKRQRIRKTPADYERHAGRIVDGWRNVATGLLEASRFQAELAAAAAHRL